jgi:hypothetical protein
MVALSICDICSRAIRDSVGHIIAANVEEVT